MRASAVVESGPSPRIAALLADPTDADTWGSVLELPDAPPSPWTRTRPDPFRAVIAHSGSFWWPSPEDGEPGRLIRDVARSGPGGAHFFLDVGLLETMDGPGGAPTQLTACREMRDALLSRGFPVTYQEYCGGHDFATALLAVAS